MADRSNHLEWVKAIGALLTPVAVIFVGGFLNNAIKEQETRARYVELAISILRDEPKPNNRNLRDWAVNVVNSYTDMKIQPPVREMLLSHSLPPPTSELFFTRTLELKQGDISKLTRAIIESLKQEQDDKQEQGELLPKLKFPSDRK